MASARDSIKAAEDRLTIARLGLKDMSQPERALSGFYNAVVFGRMVTFSLQNMRNEVEGFDEWYNPIQERLRVDSLMRFFGDLRTQIEKTANEYTEVYTKADLFRPSDILALPRPPGAKGFFIGDQVGGSGWEVELPDGSSEKYYVDLPASMGIKSGFWLPTAPADFRATDTRELLGRYLDEMETIVKAAKKKFL